MLQKSGVTEIVSKLRGVHLFACKNLLHVRNKAQNDVVYGELARYPFFITATKLGLLSIGSNYSYNQTSSTPEKDTKCYFLYTTEAKQPGCQCYVTMDSNKCGFLAVEMLNPLSRSWKIDCIVLSATDGVIILTTSERLSVYNSYQKNALKGRGM